MLRPASTPTLRIPLGSHGWEGDTLSLYAVPVRRRRRRFLADAFPWIVRRPLFWNLFDNFLVLSLVFLLAPGFFWIMRSRDTISPCSVSRTGGIARHLSERGPCEQDDSHGADELMQYGDSARHPLFGRILREWGVYVAADIAPGPTLHRSYHRRGLVCGPWRQICSDGRQRRRNERARMCTFHNFTSRGRTRLFEPSTRSPHIDLNQFIPDPKLS